MKGKYTVLFRCLLGGFEVPENDKGLPLVWEEPEDALAHAERFLDLSDTQEAFLVKIVDPLVLKKTLRRAGG